MQDRKIENSSKSDVCTICSGADCRTGDRSLAGELATKFAVRSGLAAVGIMSRYSNGAVKKLP